MATVQANVILRQVRRWAARQGGSGAVDGELVRRFAAQRDEAAFEILVERHGPMVLRVCRGVLRDPHDADDAFQATFFLLARKAGVLRRGEAVGGWLHGVARRIALKARAESARRRARERQVTPSSVPEPWADVTVREAQAILDEELARLSERYRTPLILCCLEGRTRDEAAHELACSLGSLKDRLERGRELLRSRLARRGLTLTAALGASLAASAAWAAPVGFFQQTARLAIAGAVPAHVALLAKAASPAAFKKLVVPAALLLTTCIAAGGAGFFASRTPAANADDKPTPPAEARQGDRPDPDSDGDGLSDFQELHKYFTDPHKKHTTPGEPADGDWDQRRQYAYTIRSVIRVMPPYDKKTLSDDYQDVRIRAETDRYIELEVISYPFNTNAAAITANPNWKKDYAGMKEYLAPGATTDWDAAMQKQLLEELAKAGIHPEQLTDKEVVEQVTAWLLKASKFRNMFTTHFVHFPKGRPEVLSGLQAAFDREKGDPGWSVQEALDHELLGKGMFTYKTHGTCTSWANYATTVLRALGIPTRMVLAIPIVDPCDEAQLAMVDKNIHHNQARQAIFMGLVATGYSYAAHTFNEVYVGNRWRRLNYKTLGQNILDPHLMGLLVKINTFNDLSEANLASTWGKRYALGQRDDEFRFSNPYRTLGLSDSLGKHAKQDHPPVKEKEHEQLTISRAYDWNAPGIPDWMRDPFRRRYPTGDGNGHFLVHCDEWFAGQDHLQYRVFLYRADKNFVLKAKGKPDVKATILASFYTHESSNIREIELFMPGDEYKKMANGVPYTLHPANDHPRCKWKVKEGVTLVKQDKPKETKAEHKQLTISKAYGLDAEDMPEVVKKYVATSIKKDDGRGYFFVHCDEWFADQDHTQYRRFLDRVDKNLVLRAKDQPDIKASIVLSFFTGPAEQIREIRLVVPRDEYAKMATDVAYTLHPANAQADCKWKVKEGVTVRKK